MEWQLSKLTPQEFRRIRSLIYDLTGIHLPDTKLTLLSNRLRRRMRELGLRTYKEYYELLQDPQRYQEELPHFLSAVTTNETYFFRNEALWRFVREEWIPSVVERKKRNPARVIRIWSAASSSGEEAYTTAICLSEVLGADLPRWRITIIGTDISERVLGLPRSY